MAITFYKYQGTGNDFILIDNRLQEFDKNNTKRIKQLCDRRFGIGADGLILLENHHSTDFRMVYYNADGNESTMCGNGGRCILIFANELRIIDTMATFDAIDGLHEGIIDKSLVKLKMNDVKSIEYNSNHIFLDTGSPHHVEMVADVDSIDVKTEGAKIRYNSHYKSEGVNVNFVEQVDDITFKVRTYERGVEDETLSCGTGVTAVALAMHFDKKTDSNHISLITPGGKLNVSFNQNSKGYDDIWLTGPAKFVFKGELS